MSSDLARNFEENSTAINNWKPKYSGIEVTDDKRMK